MVVVADTTPLRYLVQIEYQQILPSLFTRVLIPPAVHASCCMSRRQISYAPFLFHDWARQLPSWIELRTLASSPDEALAIALDPGEREAIQLALEQGVKILLIDERDGREWHNNWVSAFLGKRAGSSQSLLDFFVSLRTLRYVTIKTQSDVS